MKTKLVQTEDYLLFIDANGTPIVGQFHYDFNSENHVEMTYDFTKQTYHRSPILAYTLINPEAKELDLPLLPPFGEVSVENLALKAYHIDSMETLDLPPFEDTKNCVEGFIKGYKAAQQAKQYSLDDMKKAIEMARTGYGWDGNINVVDNLDNDGYGGCVDNFDKEFKFKSEEEIIQSLTTQRMPSEFIPELVIISNDKVYFDKQLKTITNSEGKQELVGIWKY